jgi:hypothetical protein
VISEDAFMDLAKLFDREGQKVVNKIPPNVTLSEIVGIQSRPDKTVRITIRRRWTLYLCCVEQVDADSLIINLKEEIKNRNEWEDRYEAWELYGSTDPYERMKRLLRSRLKNSSELAAFNQLYEKDLA